MELGFIFNLSDRLKCGMYGSNATISRLLISSFAVFYDRNVAEMQTLNTRKIPPGRPRRTWEDFIRIDLKEIGVLI